MFERQERQERLMQFLVQQQNPVRGDDLARFLGVTRQVVVHEIALMRAAGVPLVSTPRGYYIDQGTNRQQQTVLAVHHPPKLTATELYILIDHGLSVINVMVEHPLYGELKGTLQLQSRLDVDAFLQQLAHHHVTLLSSLTDGYHMHTVTYPSQAVLDQATDSLEQHQIHVLR